MALTWPLPDPGLILTLRSTEKIFCPTLSSRHWSLPTMCRNLGGGAAPVAYFHEQCGQDPCKNTCDKELRPALDTRIALGVSQMERVPVHVVMAMGWQLPRPSRRSLVGNLKVLFYMGDLQTLLPPAESCQNAYYVKRELYLVQSHGNDRSFPFPQ